MIYGVDAVCILTVWVAILLFHNYLMAGSHLSVSSSHPRFESAQLLESLDTRGVLDTA